MQNNSNTNPSTLLTVNSRGDSLNGKDPKSFAPINVIGKAQHEWVEQSGINQEIFELNCRVGNTLSEFKSLTHLDKCYQIPGGWYWYVQFVEPQWGDLREQGELKPAMALSSKEKGNGKKKSAKYLSFPSEASTHVGYLRVPLRTWEAIAQRYGLPWEGWVTKERADSGFWEWVLAHPEIPIIVTEGVKKAASLLTQGYVGISLSGVWNGLEAGGAKGNRKINESFQKILVGRGNLLFGFDADIIRKPGVATALKETNLAIKRGHPQLTTKILLWEETQGKGIDDFVVKGGCLEELIKTAVPIEECESLNEALMDDPSFEEVVAKYLREHGHYLIRSKYDEWFKWDGKSWMSYGTDELKTLLAGSNPLGVKGVLSHFSHPNAKPEDGKCQNANMPRLVASCLEHLRSVSTVTEDHLNPLGYLGLANGVLKLTPAPESEMGVKVELLTPDPLSPPFVTQNSPVRYDPGANPEFADKVLSCLEKGQREILLSTIAAGINLSFVRNQVMGVKALFLQGGGSNGKDLLRKCFSQIFDGKMSDVSLRNFQQAEEGKSEKLHKLIGSSINWASENNSKVKMENLDVLKLAISGDRMEVRRLYQDTSSTTCNAPMLFNTNHPIRMDGSSESIRRRIAILEFKKTYAINPGDGEEQADIQLSNPKFYTEHVCPALLNKLIEAFGKLCKGEEIDYSPCDEAIDAARRGTNHLLEFYEEVGLEWTGNPDDRLILKELYSQLQHWYVQEGFGELGVGAEIRFFTPTPTNYMGDSWIKDPRTLGNRIRKDFPKAPESELWRHPSLGRVRFIPGLASKYPKYD